MSELRSEREEERLWYCPMCGDKADESYSTYHHGDTFCSSCWTEQECEYCGDCKDCHPTCGYCDQCYSSGCGCEDEEDEVDGLSEGTVTASTWKLPSDMDLAEAAARFYVRQYLSDSSELQAAQFESYTNELADVFARYLDMIIGGEIRYATSRDDDKDTHQHMPRVVDRFKKETKVHGDLSRARAWDAWHALRKEYGLDILREAEAALMKGKWSGGIGGKAWGNIANVLIRYLTGELTALAFVDTVWGLEHNGGCVFNKVWYTGTVKSVLDANLHNGPKELVKFLSKTDAKEYTPLLLFGNKSYE